MTFKTDLEKDVRTILQSRWEVTKGRTIPGPKELSPGNAARKLQGTVLYADMTDSTGLVKNHQEPTFAAAVYKCYLHTAARIINNEQGSITAYDGDRIMAVFLGDGKEALAVRSALKINYAVHEIINPLLKKQYPEKKYRLKHVVGIDTSDLLVTRIGVRKDSDLVWVGRAANYAAKLCNLKEFSIYITKAVFTSIDNNLTSPNDGSQTQWNRDHWKERDNMIIYGSNACLPV